MLKITFKTSGKEKISTRKDLNYNKEGIKELVEFIANKYSDAIFIVKKSDTNVLEKVLIEGGYQYVDNGKKKSNKKETINTKEELTKAMQSDIPEDEFEGIMANVMEATAKEQVKEMKKQKREATKEELEKLEKNLKLLEGDVNRAFRIIGKGTVSKIFNSTPDAAYYILVRALTRKIKEAKEFTDGEDNEASEGMSKLRAKLIDKANNIETYNNIFVNVMAKIGLFIMNLASLFLGFGKFAVDTLIVSTVMIFRIGYCTCKEIMGAGRGIKRSFKKNILKKDDAFNLDNYVEEDVLKEAVNRHEDKLAKLQARLDEIRANKENKTK